MVVPGVPVTVTQTATGITRTSVTNEAGGYVIVNLPVGPYRLEASLPGFRTYRHTGITLQVGSSPTVDAVLRVGEVAESVEVQADVRMVETRRTGVGQVMDNVRLLELPLAGRQVTELITLTAPAVQAVQGDARGGDRYYSTMGIAVAGGKDNALNWRLDGGTHNDPFGHLNAPLPFPDAVQEFRVDTSALAAQYGQLSAGAINVVTKSGTNVFHGSLFDFVRHNTFNARNAFAVTDDGLRRSQFGGTVGGPVARNRVFFFGGYQGTRQRSRPTTQQSLVPTAEMLAGDWRRFASAECSARPVALRAPFVGNQIDPARYSPVATNILAQLPTTDDPCGVLRFGMLNDLDEDIVVGRVDFRLSAAHQVFARYMIHERLEHSSYDDQTILSLGTENDRRYQSAVVGSTSTLSATVVNSFRATLLRTRNDLDLPQDFFTLADMGAKNVWYPEGWKKTIRLNVTGGFQVIAPASSNDSVDYEVSDDLSWLLGSHQLGFGGQWLHRRFNFVQAPVAAGNLTFTGGFTGLGLADFMLGSYSAFTQGGVSTWHPRQNYVGLFVQDTWPVSSRLTMNLGLRWEPYLPHYREGEPYARFEREWFDRGVRSTVFPNAPVGLLYNGDPGMPDDNKISENQWMQFAPRVGLAFDPGGDGRMVIRTGYGLFYDYPHMMLFSGMASQSPFDMRVTRRNVQNGLNDPWAGYPGGNPMPVAVGPDVAFLPGALLMNVPEDSKAPYVHEWHLTVQRQVGTDWMVGVNYLGSQSIHLLDVREANPGVYIPGSTASLANRRVLALANPTEGRVYGNINALDDGGTASYNALWLQVQRRRARGLTAQGNYTWSHCIDDDADFTSGAAGKFVIERRGANRGNCRFDRRHSFSMSAVYELPQFSNPTVRALASNWGLSLIARAESGSFLTVLCGCDNAGTGETGREGVDEDRGQRANQVLDDPYAPNKDAEQYLNPAAFAAPEVGTYGNTGRRSIQGPGSFRIDMGLSRVFRIRNSHSIELRAEALNLTNRVNLGNPITWITDPNFGRILSAGDPRIMQFAVKYGF